MKRIVSMVFCLLVAMTGAAKAQVFGVSEALKVLQFAGRSPISMSADGEWVAYTVSDDSKRKTYGDARYKFYTPTGAFLEALGCDVWLSNSRTHETRNLTEGKGTSWDPVWSPDGRYLAFYSDRSGVAHLWVWEKTTGQMQQLGNDVVRPFFNFQVPKWTPDSTHVLVRTLAAGMTVEDEADRQYGPEVKAGAALVKDESATTVSVLSFDPAQAQSAEKPKEAMTEAPEWMQRYETDLTLVDVRSGVSDHLVKGDRPLGYWVSPDGTMVAWTHMKELVANTQQTRFDLRVLKLGDRAARTLVSSFDTEYGISVSWSPDSRSLAYTTAGQLAKGDAYVVKVEGGEPVLLTPGEHPLFSDDHRAPLWDAKGEYVYFESTETYTRRGQPGIWRSAVAHPEVKLFTEIPGHVITEVIAPAAGGRLWSPDGGASMIVAAREEATKRQAFYKVDLATGAASKVYEADQYLGGDFALRMDVSSTAKSFAFVAQEAQHPEDVWVDGGDLHAPVRISSVNKSEEGIAFGGSRIIDYNSIDGEPLHGALLLPANYKQGEKYPMIVDPYGGSFRSNSVFRFAGNKWGTASYGADYPEVSHKDNIAPRVGIAYALDDKTVIRAGYGIYFGQAFYPGWGGGMSQDGFNKNLNLSESPNGAFKQPALYLSTGISPTQVGSTASNINSAFDNGNSPSLYRPLDGNKRPYSSQWNLTIERQLPHNLYAGVSYVGTKGTHLPSALSPLNVLNPYNPAIAAIGSDLNVSYTSANGPAVFAAHGVSEPYVGWASQMTGCSPTLQQALVPYPQYCGVLQGDNEGHANSIYNSFQAHIERHITNGLYILGSLTVQKLYTNGAYSTQSASAGIGTNASFSPYNTSRAWAIAPDNVPITAQVAVVYDLPFGSNKPFLNQSAVLSKIVGGWQISPIYRYEFGTPLSFYSSTCDTSTVAGSFHESCVPGIISGQSTQPHGRNGFNPAHESNYLSPAAFESSSAFTTFGYTGYGKAVSTVYGPTYENLDVSFTKNTKFAEKLNFKFSANFFNAFNMHALISQGNGPGSSFVTDVSNSAFGTWNGDASAPRSIQFAGRLEF